MESNANLNTAICFQEYVYDLKIFIQNEKNLNINIFFYFILTIAGTVPTNFTPSDVTIASFTLV